MVDKIWYNMEELIGGSEERGINRNILECKESFSGGIQSNKIVLIETYWNVKIFESIFRKIILHGINRNILECKVLRNRHTVQTFRRINRNILECKDKQSARSVSA